jgi:cell division transport system permease protein
MAISVGYMVKETSNNLRHNLLMTVGAMLTVSVSLVFLGGALLSRQAVNKQTARWKGGVELSVFMKPDASQSQIDAVKAQLDGLPGVKKLRFVDHASAFKEMKTLFADQPNVVDSLTADQAPPSFRVVPSHAELVDTIGERFKDQPGVYQVVYAKDAIRSLIKSSDRKNRVLLTIAAVVLVSAVLLILTTIQLAIFARRREVGVMKLVGATNWFIRVPFMLEGMVQGLVGAVVAFGVVLLGRNVVIGLVADPAFGSSLNKLFVTNNEATFTGIVLLLVGSVVGASGSAFAVRRYLVV